MSPNYEVLAVRYATRTAPASQVYLNFHLYGEADHPVGMDYFFWVVRSADRTILVDTGFTPSVGDARGRTTTCPPAEALVRIGLDPATVDTVVITHAHYDHAGNLDLFPHARMVIAARELDFWTGPYARRHQFAHVVEQSDIDRLQRLDGEGRLTRISGSHQVAPGVELFEVGGHTQGQLVVHVTAAARGPVLLASDAVHFYDELELDRPFYAVADLADVYRGFDTVRDLAASSGAVLVPGHDPLVMQRFPALDPDHPELGVRVG